jgi:hypothetical protein
MPVFVVSFMALPSSFIHLSWWSVYFPLALCTSDVMQAKAGVFQIPVIGPLAAAVIKVGPCVFPSYHGFAVSFLGRLIGIVAYSCAKD